MLNPLFLSIVTYDAVCLWEQIDHGYDRRRTPARNCSSFSPRKSDDQRKSLCLSEGCHIGQNKLITISGHKKIVGSDKIGMAVANNFGLPLIDLDSIELDSIPISLVSEKLIRRHNVIPLFNRGKQLYIAIDDPTKQASLKEIQFHTGLYTNSLIVETDKLYELIERLLNKKDTQGLSDYFEESPDLEGIEFSADEDEEKEADVGSSANK